MFKHAPLFALLLLAAGCARDDNSSAAIGSNESTVVAARSMTGGRLVSPAAVRMQPTVGAGHTFASLPDRGNLVGYPARPVVRRDGAYTWHRAELSEQHAIRAIATGVMRIKAPSGQELEFRYDRHEEYPNGDWSWVGHLIDGSQADDVVITFGAKAAFGTIAQPAGKAPLRLTIQNGVSWLVETDRAGIAAIHNSATDPKRPDYLVPPKTAASAQTAASDAASGVTASGAPATAAATTAGDSVVDLVLGYTPGFVAGLGGDSQAQTRLNNMVAITNEAYVNSQVPGRVRLVKTVLVNYPDATLNDTALEELTGFKAPSTRTTPAAAFSALRAAREQYGADLVSLVRKFNDPENDGCGIAWLNGGSSTGRGSIDRSDEFFGYSVVSDGRDTGTDGKTYFCREETLAHELGHNMGSQHDRATATENGKVSYGVYPYSFGYKTDSASGNFYTIMAYGDRGQTAYRTFSNPRITTCGQRPCGLDNQADVARSLSQTMPVVASFRASTVPDVPILAAYDSLVDAKATDVDADGRADLLWRLDSQASWAFWTMDGSQKTGGVGYNVGAAWKVVATGDFNADRRLDLIWTDGTSMQMWIGSAAGFVGQAMRTYPTGWKVVAASDFNGDGRTDLLWRDDSSSYAATWLMQGASINGSASFAVPQAWRVVGSGDLSGDGRADVIWTNGAAMQLWVSAGTGFVGQTMPDYPTGWVLAGIGDVDGDRKDDLIWHDAYSGQIAWWRMSAGTRISGLGFAGGTSEHPLQVADFTGDGRVDVLWAGGGYMYMMYSTGNGFTASPTAAPAYPSGWFLIRR